MILRTEFNRKELKSLLLVNDSILILLDDELEPTISKSEPVVL